MATYKGGDRFTVSNPKLDPFVLERTESLDELITRWHNEPPDTENTTSDVLAYLMHIVELCGQGWDEQVERARFHYEDEREGL
jgi:hypothetical protein